MNKHFLILLVLFFTGGYIFSQDYKVEQEIPDPFGTYSKFQYEKYMDERYYPQDIDEYLDFRDKLFSDLELVSGKDDLSQINGEWHPVNKWLPEHHIRTGKYEFFSYHFQDMEIYRVQNSDEVYLSFYAKSTSKIYKYGNYYLSRVSIPMGGVGPLVLLNIIEDRCYFYTLEGSTWKLLPYHKGGEVYLKKERPNS